MKKIKNIILSLVMAMSFGLTFIPTTSVGALDIFPACEGTASDPAICESEGDDATNIIKTIINTLMFLLGAVSVIMIIYSGIQYVLSAGNTTKVDKAKNTLLYSVVGLVVAILAASIVGFVAGAL